MGVGRAGKKPNGGCSLGWTPVRSYQQQYASSYKKDGERRADGSYNSTRLLVRRCLTLIGDAQAEEVARKPHGRCRLKQRLKFYSKRASWWTPEAWTWTRVLL